MDLIVLFKKRFKYELRFKYEFPVFSYLVSAINAPPVGPWGVLASRWDEGAAYTGNSSKRNETKRDALCQPRNKLRRTYLDKASEKRGLPSGPHHPLTGLLGFPFGSGNQINILAEKGAFGSQVGHFG